MIACPGCGSNIRFDIASQKMKCEYCGKYYSPDDVQLKSRSGTSQTDDETMEVTVFTCPQCGAGMYSEDASATAFCPYCGADNILEQRLEGVKRPTHIVPFAKTEDECRTLIKKEIDGFPFAPRAFRKGAILDRLRPVYLPYWNIETEEDGLITGTMEKNYSEGDTDITETYDVEVSSKSRCEGILFDASAVFDDTLAAEIAPFPTEGQKAFRPAYLAGFYAESANVDSFVYEEEAGRIADGRADYELKEQLEMDVKVKKRPEHAFSAKSMMFPVWFSSIRQGNRVCYAVANGYTGKVYCDMPIDIIKYLLATLVLAVPIFALFNAFFTFTPLTTLFIAAVVGLVISIVAASVTNSVRKRNEHTDDRGYRSLTGALPTKEDYARDAAESKVSEETARAETEKEKKKKKKAEAAREQKEKIEEKAEDEETFMSKMVKVLLLPFIFAFSCIVVSLQFLIIALAVIFIVAAGFLIYDNLHIFLYVIGILGLLISVLINSYTVDMSGHQAASGEFGETGVSKKGGNVGFHFPGAASVLINAAIIAGGVIAGRKYTEDVYYYFGTTLILAASLIGIVLIVLKQNELSTRPLPFLNAEAGGTADKQNKTKKPKKTKTLLMILLTVLSVAAPTIGKVSKVSAEAPAASDYQYTEDGYEYRNPETGYAAIIYDNADLLSDEEERALADEIEYLTGYGNIGFISGNDPSMTDYADYREEVYRDAFGTESGTVFFIDMTNRKVSIFSDGANYKVITSDYAESITDNVYQYATDGDYYQCASEAFAEIGKLLDGGSIAQPMKYINNLLISLILSGLIVWITILIFTGSKARSRKEVVEGIGAEFVFTDCKETLIDIRKHSKSSGLGGDGGGGGGSSGGGGSHGF